DSDHHVNIIRRNRSWGHHHFHALFQKAKACSHAAVGISAYGKTPDVYLESFPVNRRSGIDVHINMKISSIINKHSHSLSLKLCRKVYIPDSSRHCIGNRHWVSRSSSEGGCVMLD